MRGPIAQILATVAEAFGITRNELLSHRRPKQLVQARFMAIGLSRELTHASLTLLGRAFDRDHTSCLHAVRRDREFANRDPDYAAMRRAILAKLTQ